MTLIDLGWCIARLDKGKHLLKIVSPSDESTSLYVPSESITIYSQPSLEALRDALIEAYPVGG